MEANRLWKMAGKNRNDILIDCDLKELRRENFREEDR
jgi:hypothetical protein